MMPMQGWTIEVLNAASNELAVMPKDIRARFERIVHTVENHGLAALREPYVKHLEGKLWEMRMTGRDGIARAIYFTATGKRVVVVRAFIKKTQKAPRSEIETAHKRMKEWNNDKS